MAYKICQKCGETNPQSAVACICGSSLLHVEVQGIKDSKKYAEFESSDVIQAYADSDSSSKRSVGKGSLVIGTIVVIIGIVILMMYIR